MRFETSADAMGTTFSLVLYGEDRDKLESASRDALDEARRLDNLLSNYKPESEWSRVNRGAAGRPVPVSKELYDLLSLCVQYSMRTEAAFDITVGPLMNIWGFYKGTGHLPKPDEVKKATAHVGYGNLLLDDSSHTVKFARTGMNLDPGGIGKGYAVDRMADVLKKDGVQAALISAGGSSIYGLGAPPAGSGWKVRMNDGTEALLENESLSTSGSAEKFFVAEGKTWSHIMDPGTGYPAQGTLSVSVLTQRTVDGEAWAKPYFIKGRQWTASHKPREQRVFYCEDKANQPCVWLQ